MSRLIAALAGDPEIEALLSDESQLDGILRFEVALAHAQADAGLVDHAAAGAIAAAVETFVPDWQDLMGGTVRDGVVVPTVISQLRAILSELAGEALHCGATSQDAIDTALMLQLRAVLPVLQTRLTGIRTQLAALADRYGANRLMAHTRMQAALPFLVADKLHTWDEAFERHQEALHTLSTDLLVVQLGGPVGNRSGLGRYGDEVAQGVANRLGLRAAAPWHTVRDRVVGLGSRLAMLAGTLGKVGADIALLTQSEVATMSLAGGGASSAMPHKTNPVGAELLVTLAHYAAGLAGTLHHAMIHENERSGTAWTLEWLTLPPLIITTGASLRTAATLLNEVAEFGSAPQS